MGEICINFCTWSANMALSLGWQWPTLTVEIPPAKSICYLPVLS